MILLGLLMAAEVVRLSPEAAAAARAEGEARALAQYEREDAVAAAKRQGRGLLGLGVGRRPLAQGHAPLGDVGQSSFVYTPGSVGYSRYRDN